MCTRYFVSVALVRSFGLLPYLFHPVGFLGGGAGQGVIAVFSEMLNMMVG